MNEELPTINMIDIIPQRTPFVMVDKLIYFDPITTISEFTICEDNIFLSENKFSSTGLIENIAQTCAARIGYMNRLQKESIKIGYIGSVKNLKILGNPDTGDTIRTQVTVREEVFKMTLVDAEVTLNGEIIVRAEMKIALSDTGVKE